MTNLYYNQEKLNLPKLKLTQAIDTRWNSEYLKEKRLQENKQPLTLSINETGCKAHRSALQWQQMSQFVHIAKPFYEATELMSGERYPSLSSVIPVINNFSEITKDSSRSGQGTEQLKSFAKNSRFKNSRIKDSQITTRQANITCWPCWSILVLRTFL